MHLWVLNSFTIVSIFAAMFVEDVVVSAFMDASDWFSKARYASMYALALVENFLPSLFLAHPLADML